MIIITIVIVAIIIFYDWCPVYEQHSPGRHGTTAHRKWTKDDN